MNIDIIIARAAKKQVVTLLNCIVELHKSLKLHALPHANAPSQGFTIHWHPVHENQEYPSFQT